MLHGENTVVYSENSAEHVKSTLCGQNTKTVSIARSGIQDFFRGGGGGLSQEFFSGGSTNSVEERGQREWGSGGGSPLVRGSTQFANE
jgi:hypothetical protein